MDIKPNSLYNADCLEVIASMPDNYLNLTLTSVPYNVDLGNNKLNKNKYATYDDNKEHTEYLQWLQSIFKEILLKTKSSGRCVINIGAGKNGRIPIMSDVTNFMLESGWLFYTDIIWYKKNIGSRTAWGSFKSPSSPSFPHPYEHILVFCKDSYKLKHKGETDLIKKEFIDWSNALWTITPETRMMKKFNHPAMFPEELARRCIKMFSYIDDLVFDPFSGAATTATVAKKLRRRYIGSEISQQYHETAIERLNSTVEEEPSKEPMPINGDKYLLNNKAVKDEQLNLY